MVFFPHNQYKIVYSYLSAFQLVSTNIGFIYMNYVLPNWSPESRELKCKSSLTRATTSGADSLFCVSFEVTPTQNQSHRLSPPSPTQIDPFYTHGESIKMDDKLDETWVTVFGIPQSATSFVLQEFSVYGQIIRHIVRILIKFPRENLNEIISKFSKEYFNEIIPRFSIIKNFSQDYLNLGLVQIIGLYELSVLFGPFVFSVLFELSHTESMSGKPFIFWTLWFFNRNGYEIKSK